ncbi:hypothetical protein BXZ70DRAFT_954747 [Cristinia sonorae]|uniref:Polyketide synthase-like phosphopantetheine-binding domain-containing protein n=1 Tax=Cristinia sonorae TaxID=1940300 RepID=A0A8K0XLD1_9AGAR|nr:hypothetical protein BXZ70DRAFT_954747 [Cristinia sonorae]
MAPPTQTPPVDGSIYPLPGFVDFRAEHTPSNPWVVFPSPNDPTKTSSLSFRQLAEATHRIAHALRPARVGSEYETVAILVNCDSVMYIATISGMLRAGQVPYPMSPKNSPEAVCHMLKTTHCHRIVTQPSISALVSAVRSILEKQDWVVEVVELPALHDAFPSLSTDPTGQYRDVSPYPPPQIPRQLKDVAFYIHSSGSTGMPKSIPFTEQIVLQWADSALIRESCKHQLLWGNMALPTFHSIGIMAQVLLPLVSGLWIALFTPQAPAPPTLPNPVNMIEVAKLAGCTVIGAVPIFIEMWARSQETVKYLATLKAITWAGGPMSEANGSMLVKAGVNLTVVYGTTEIGLVSKFMDMSFDPNPPPGSRLPEDWSWLQIDENTDHRWVDQGDGTYELQILATDSRAVSVENLPDVRGFATRDVFKPHPTKPGLWQIVGRADDVMVLRTGEKLVPLPQEDRLNSVPIVSSAIMFGRGQDQPGILIELIPAHAIDPEDEAAVIALRNELWPHVEEANKRAPAYARIFKEMILFASPAKPFVRAPKGTAIRPVVIKDYEKEISDLYAKIDESVGVSGVVPPNAWTPHDVEVWLADQAASINKGHAPSTTIDLSEQGFDSLSATFLRNRIIAVLRCSEDRNVKAAASSIPQGFVFQYPTLIQLSKAIVGLVDPEFKDTAQLPLTEEIEAMIRKYSSSLPTFKTYQPPSPGSAVVLLTGSTGALGSHLLASLLGNKNVAEVITLNRGGDVTVRQRKVFEERGLDVKSLLSEKWTSLIGDIKQESMGLPDSLLAGIRTRVTYIIHNAWKVDFNLSLSSFEIHVASTRVLINFSASCDNPVRFLLTSSVSSVYAWDVTQGAIPEKVLDDPNVGVMSGYGSSKYAAEHVLALSARAGLSATAARIGQICGSTTSGDWSTTEWVPILVKTSLALGFVPDLSGNVSWIPMDTTAQTIVDALLSACESIPEVFNVVHPNPVSWRDVFAALNDVVGNRMKVISLSEWVKKVEILSSSTSTYDVHVYLAIKLLRFFKALVHSESAHADKAGGRAVVEAAGLPTLQTTRAEELSLSLRLAPAIGMRDVEGWVNYWRRVGFIDV